MYEKSNHWKAIEQRDKWDMPSSQEETNFILFSKLQQKRLRLYIIKNSPQSEKLGHWKVTQKKE